MDFQTANCDCCRSKTISSDDDEILVVAQMLAATSKGDWIVDSGTTCHMSNDETIFSELKMLSTSKDVTIGDGRSLKCTAVGPVRLETLLPNGGTTRCTLTDVLLVPKLVYSLLSMSKILIAVKTMKCDMK